MKIKLDVKKIKNIDDIKNILQVLDIGLSEYKYNSLHEEHKKYFNINQ